MKTFKVIPRCILKAACGSATAIALLFSGSQNELRAQTMPPNLDFSAGNFTNWLCYTAGVDTGSATTGTKVKNAVLSGPVAGPPSRHAITSGSGIDPVGQLKAVAPGGDTFSMRIGNSNIGASGAESQFIRYNLHVPSGTTKYSLLYQFAVVLENPGHPTNRQATFHVVVYDSATGAVIPSANNLYDNGSLPSVVPYLTNLTKTVYFHNWAPSTLNFSGYGGKTVVVEAMVSDCADAGHFGYAYFDVTSVTDYLAPAISNCDRQTNTVQVQGPPGYKYYQWYDQNFSAALNSPNDTSRSRTLPLPATPQYYNLVLFPISSTGTPDTIRTNVFSSFTIHASALPSSVTPGQTVYLNAAVLGGMGSLSYQWSGDTTLSGTNISNPMAHPLTGTQYVVTVTDTNGCFQRDTVQVNVGPLGTGPQLGSNESFTVANLLTPAISSNGICRIVRIQPGSTLRSFRIYNSLGQKVFETTNAADGWDGTINGATQPAGVYVYVLEGISNGKMVKQQGSLTLIR
jgi:hypothetical protein